MNNYSNYLVVAGTIVTILVGLITIYKNRHILVEILRQRFTLVIAEILVSCIPIFVQKSVFVVLICGAVYFILLGLEAFIDNRAGNRFLFAIHTTTLAYMAVSISITFSARLLAVHVAEYHKSEVHVVQEPANQNNNVPNLSPSSPPRSASPSEP